MDCPCYPDLAAIPEPIDCVVLAVPNRHVPDLLESAAAAGVRAGVVFSAGFAEIAQENNDKRDLKRSQRNVISLSVVPIATAY